MPGFHGAQAGHAGRPPMMQEFLAGQPAAIGGTVTVLRGQPAPVRCPDRGRRITAFGRLLPVAQQPLGGEQGHLGVVGYRPGPAVSGDVAVDPARPVAAADVGEGEKLDARAQGLADRAAEQAAAEAVAQRDQRAPSSRARWPASAPIARASSGLSG
jgi:hypothetical protein